MADADRFAKLGASVSDLTVAFQDRLSDANALLAGGSHAAAIASGLYAIEIFLKTRICKLLALNQMPKVFEIHDLYGLATAAGLRAKIDDPVFKQSKTGQNWARVLANAEKLNELRYQPDVNWSPQDAADLLDCLQDPTDGVIPWIQKQP
jgi:hypothetical protein